MEMGQGQGQGDGQGPRRAYADAQWAEQLQGFPASSPHLSPNPEYGVFHYSQSPSEHLPAGSTLHHHHQHQHHMDPPPLQPLQALRPLVVPPWPSTLTSQSNFAPPLLPPSVPISTPISAASSHSTQSTHSTQSAQSTHSTHSTSSPRRTLTDADRPMFGVERSTVSKVLRNKDKYLNPDDGSRSPIRRSKGRFPDIERALSNWARNTQRSGTAVTDEMIREKARFFANTVGNSESHTKIASGSWLEKFKQKNRLAGAKAPKHPAEAGALARRKSDGSPVIHTPNGISPISPKGMPSPLPLSSTRSQENLKTEGHDDYMHHLAGGYRLYNSQSATSLSSMFNDATPSSFSAGPTSPTSPFFPPEGAPAPPSHFYALPQARLPSELANNYSRPRRQTFPNLADMDPSSSEAVAASPDDLTPRFVNPAMTDSPRTDSPQSGMPPPPPPPPTLHPPSREPMIGPTAPKTDDGTSSSSPSSIQPPSRPAPHNSHVMNPSFGRVTSPTPEDARRALEVVMAFFQHQPSGLVDPHEFMTMGKLMEKLRVQGGGGGGGGGGMPLPGGLHQIPEQDELAPGPTVSNRIETSAAAGL